MQEHADANSLCLFFSPMEGWSGGAASAHAHHRTHSRLITKNKENKVNEFFLEYYYI